jgi:DNA modification methylase
MNPELQVNEKFVKGIPPLTPEEFKGLEQNCLENGIRDALVIWEKTIIDGHNRYAIAQKHNLPFTVIQKDFINEQAAIIWIVNNQLDRRNLSDYQRFELIQWKKEQLLQVGQEKQKETLKKGNEMPVLPLNGKTETHNTQKEIAKDLGWSKGKISQADIINKEADEETKQKLRAGNETIHSAYQKIQKAKRQELLNKPIIYSNDTAPQITKSSWGEWLQVQPQCDLLLTDPPYSTDVEDIYTFAQWLPLALAKVKDTGRAYIFIGAYPQEIEAYLRVQKNTNMILSNILVWTYRNTIGPSPKNDYKLNWQAILYFRGINAPPLNCPIMTEQFTVQDINAPDGRLGNRFHTWQKPDEIAERFICHSTKKGDLILDCFAGTGTFLLAAARLGRFAKGCDLSQEMIDIAIKRGCHSYIG